ncbi:MAG: nucleotidyltransferase domain-containing protein [Labilithrix sp.]|nr:nucleotidyltransferase domain-containing protein [Labilithrix sp.]MCW5814935.1 nucleotidyltransferase domain-containing protein [Labilithrix sp.]
MTSREELNAYDLGLPLPLAPLEERRHRVPPEVVLLLKTRKERAMRLLGERFREMRLFGSYARGQFNEDSDVDVLVVTAPLAPGERARVVGEVACTTPEGLIVSPIVLSDVELDELRRREALLVQDIDREGITL